MNLRRAYEELQATTYLDRTKSWAPVDCIECPRKAGQIANDRCLEYQERDGCRCSNAATRSVRSQLEVDEHEACRRRAARHLAVVP